MWWNMQCTNVFPSLQHTRVKLDFQLRHNKTKLRDRLSSTSYWASLLTLNIQKKSIRHLLKMKNKNAFQISNFYCVSLSISFLIFKHNYKKNYRNKILFLYIYVSINFKKLWNVLFLTFEYHKNIFNLFHLFIFTSCFI